MFEGTQDEARAALPPRLTLTSRADPAGLPGVASASVLGRAEADWVRYEVALRPGADPDDLLEACTAQGFVLRGFDVHRPALHEVFIHLVGGGQEIVR